MNFLRRFPFVNVTALSMTALTLCLPACSLAPAYHHPTVESNIPLSAMQIPVQAQLKAHTISWHNYFNDPRLKALVKIGLKNNYQVQKAMLKLKAANAQYGLDTYNLFPNLEFQGIKKTRSAPLNYHESKELIRKNYSAGLGVTHFELDLYRKFDQADAYKHTIQANLFDQASARIAFISSLAKKYFSVVTNAAFLKNAQQNVGYQREIYRVQKLRYHSGVISKLELLTHQNALEMAESAVLDAQQTYDKSRNELALLVGQPISQADLPAALSLAQQFKFTVWPENIPAEVMLYRPDIRAAEEMLRKSNAELGVARSAFFPRVIINAALSTAAPHFNALFSSRHTAWSAGPAATIPIFDIFPNLSQLKLAKIQKEGLLLDYQQAIQQAFFEVTTAMQVYNQLDAQYKLDIKLLANTRKIRDLTRLRFNEGISSRNEMLEEEKKYIETQNKFLKTQLLKLFNQVDLYRALGGGSDQLTENATAQSQ